MTRLLMAAALALVVGAAGAQSQASETSTIREGGKLIRIGDSPAKVHQVLGEPDSKVQLENRLGGAAGMRWEYYSAGSGYQKRAYTITINGGQVVRMTSEALR
jgi:hypothetical protein